MQTPVGVIPERELEDLRAEDALGVVPDPSRHECEGVKGWAQFTNQNIDTAPEDDLGFDLGSHQASDLFEQEAGCRRIAGPETIERPGRLLVTAACARTLSP